MMKPKMMTKKELFQFGGSSEQQSSLRVTPDALCHDLCTKKLTNTVPSTPSAAINEDKDSCPDSGAIDTDNTDWEDSNDEKDIKSGVDKMMFFKHTPSRAPPPPKRESLLTLALQPGQDHGYRPHFGHIVPKSIFPDVQRARSPFSPMKVSPGESDGPRMRMRQKPSRAPTPGLDDAVCSSAQLIPTTSNGTSGPLVFSPRTTRLNMVASELTESLCRNLLWEREEKTLTANAVLKRRHHANEDVTTLDHEEDVATLDQYPQQSHTTEDPSNIDARSCENLTWEAFAGYHAKGW